MRRGRIDPFDGKIGDGKTEPLREQHHFDIKRKSIDARAPENGVRCGMPKSFESALRVVDRDQAGAAQKKIEALAERAPQQ
jgi:hypothetical protein